MNNMELYEKVRKAPERALKPILGGRLKGKSDISPMWRIEVLTEQFGPCGVGWYPVIKKMWLEPGANGETAAFVEIDLFIKIDGAWSVGIPGVGGSMFVAKEEKGLYTSDECFKMAYTDAISVSCKALGIAADIYWGDSKYKTDGNQKGPKGPAQAPTKTSTDIYKCATCGKAFKETYYQGKHYTSKEVHDEAARKYGKAECGICRQKTIDSMGFNNGFQSTLDGARK